MSESPHTARVTGLLYLGLGLSGMLGFLVVRTLLFDPDDAGATINNLVEHESLARAGLALELMLVLTQALTAAWFYRLFRPVDPVAAAGIAAFGLVNAVAVMVSAALLATALRIALDPVGDAAATVHLLYLISGGLWTAGSVFFGLWLVPMGRCVLATGRMPRALGWTLIGGGVGYVLQPFLGHLAPAAQPVADALVIPATVGEFWIIGYLLIRGTGRDAADPPVGPSPVAPVAPTLDPAERLGGGRSRT